jgi:hypothetical protein
MEGIMLTFIRFLSILVAAVALLLDSSHASTHDFYRGKTIRIVVGFSAGGGYDAYSRVIARHMGRHIPGSCVLESNRLQPEFCHHPLTSYMDMRRFATVQRDEKQTVGAVLKTVGTNRIITSSRAICSNGEVFGA